MNAQGQGHPVLKAGTVIEMLSDFDGISAGMRFLLESDTEPSPTSGGFHQIAGIRGKNGIRGIGTRYMKLLLPA